MCVCGRADRPAAVRTGRDRAGRIHRLNRAAGGGPSRWLPLVAFAAYLAFVAGGWRVPDASGAPLVLTWALAVCLGVGVGRLRRGRFEPLVALVVAVAVAALLTDVTEFQGGFLRDLGIYLKAGDHFTAGRPVYLTAPLTARPADLTDYPFLYPPLTLPFFALLAALPRPLVEAGWLLGSALAALAGLRVIGLSWRWAIAALFWPPFFQGLYVGNVAIPAFALFAVAPVVAAGLVPAAIFKAYSAVAALWLVRERRYVALGAGVAVVAAAVVGTLPLVGIDAWRAWLEGLRLYSDSERALPELLAKMSVEAGLLAHVPMLAAVAGAAGAAVVAVAWAWRARGLAGLARFGVATIVASPSLFAHGFPVALPAFLSLRPEYAWLAIGITSVAPGFAWWLALGLVGIASLAPGLRSGSAWVWPSARRPAGRDPAPGP